MSGNTTLVTGASGFVGQHLLRKLRGQRVVAWYYPKHAPPAPSAHVTWRAVDLLDRETVESALGLDAPDEIYHLAGAPQVDASWQNVVPHLRTNALGTYYLLESIQRLALACRLLVVTSAQIYQSSDEPIDEDAPMVPPTPYGLSKLAQDQLALRAAHEDGLDVVLARPFNHTGPGQDSVYAVPSFARQIARIEAGLEPAVITVGNLDSRRDITDVRDVVDAYRLMMQGAPPGRPYNICSGRAWRIGDLLDELLQSAGVEVEVRVEPSRLRPQDVPVLQGDATRIRSELGWMPHRAVEETLRDTLAWWRKRSGTAH